MAFHIANKIDTRFALARALADEAGALALDYFNRRETLVIEQKRIAAHRTNGNGRHCPIYATGSRPWPTARSSALCGRPV